MLMVRVQPYTTLTCKHLSLQSENRLWCVAVTVITLRDPFWPSVAVVSLLVLLYSSNNVLRRLYLLYLCMNLKVRHGSWCSSATHRHLNTALICSHWPCTESVDGLHQGIPDIGWPSVYTGPSIPRPQIRGWSATFSKPAPSAHWGCKTMTPSDWQSPARRENRQSSVYYWSKCIWDHLRIK